jgi:hypothetical protein
MYRNDHFGSQLSLDFNQIITYILHSAFIVFFSKVEGVFFVAVQNITVQVKTHTIQVEQVFHLCSEIIKVIKYTLPPP